MWLTSRSLQYLDTLPFSGWCGDQNNNKSLSRQEAEGEKLAGLLSQRSSQVNKTNNICLINERQIACEASPPRISKQPTPTHPFQKVLPITRRGRWNWASKMQLLQVHTEAMCSWLLQSVHTSPAHQRSLGSFWLFCEPPAKQSSLKWHVTISRTVSQCLRVVTHPAVLVLPETGDYGWGVGLEPIHGLHYLLRAGLGCKPS